MLISQKSLIILYGSQTGNSQDLAERIWRKAKSFQIDTKLCSFDKIDLNLLISSNVRLLCVCSTTGQGDIPDNMKTFWNMIMRKNIPSNIFQELEFGVIGLGDSSYEKFNYTAKKLYKRFIQLGAKSLLDLCLCDEQQKDGIEGAYSNWISLFWPFYLNNDQREIICSKNKVLKYKIIHTNQDLILKNEFENNEPACESKPFYAKLIKNERVTNEKHFQNVRLIEFDCANSTNSMKYEAGDVLALRPSNIKENVEKFLEIFEHLKLDLNQKIRIISNYENEIEMETNLSQIGTVKDLIEKYFDLNSIPKMSFFEQFSNLATDELEKEKLTEFMTPEGLEDLYNYCYRPRRTIIEVFYDFPNTSKNINNLDVLIDLIPSIKPRSFSIASSPFVHKDKIQLLVAVVEYKTRLYETRKGTCSYWLSNLNPSFNLSIPVWIRKGSFKIDWSKPLICIGPGTGVAPFRSIINERIYKHNQFENNLYFGCRSKEMDFYFEHEWSAIQNGKPPNFFNLNVAFSRDQEHKVYVQDKLLENSDHVFNLIHNLNCLILIAGNSKRMPDDVLAILEKIIRKNMEKISTNANTNLDELTKMYIKTLKNNFRIQLETWS